ncbi:MAG: type I methionyl aminopeptidase [Candidatus Spechtbacteria bacterium RIFCSPHIGHO2_02_FULL_43_15b]|uniref:Methionine aminopeptidase n=1 Tax=Candidatus Spechtbacteria bacterium RIFCSPHIGHO2_01_FULL_43_30 TaxID=1802158 RepID=A0A1G2H5H2_9BACT|nr:MAG: type I methionyl aminopeptidase [Candidatus Spechtbacteria bacterium RIFCSPHIGHO2_01_FULL_43_30]OGZ58820.1 MAG: type I methionyl aminopeptidase [Candidatus Spechtbacteria bacterium RIFCSPHIGHO2_02_FULL_43_15b]
MSISIKTNREIELMRESGRIAAEILGMVSKKVDVGVRTKELDIIAEDMAVKYKVKPAFRGEESGKSGEPYPFVLCASVNEVIVHGLPSDYLLKDGDILGLDFGVIYEGYYSDVAATIPVGNISEEAHRLIRVTKKALNFGIKKVRPGNTIGDIGNTVQRYVESQGFGVVRDLVGHGIGKSLHEDPQVPNYGKRHKGEKLEEGMVLAIEPMVTMGSWEVSMSADGYGYETSDKSLSAHFEHTVLVSKNGCEILTRIK